MTKLTIPEIRARMHQLAEEYGIEELHDLAEATKRTSPVRRKAPIKSRELTPQLAIRIRNYARRNPTLSYAEIAQHYNVNPGRVSEAMHRVV
jgi:hypothetical protein